MHVHIYSGLPGVGKSTRMVCDIERWEEKENRTVEGVPKYAVLEIDHIRHSLYLSPISGTSYSYAFEEEVKKIALYMFKTLIRKKVETIYLNDAFLTRNVLEPYLEEIEKGGYKYTIYQLTGNKEAIWKRNGNREEWKVLSKEEWEKLYDSMEKCRYCDLNMRYIWI